ncbi:kinase-like domain-containing protein [Suillus clintonianus]|uniref:kinase-like domain-containing protein n=1 Tax=Suillus clintonianus TaxID=1904413 RepID=UPI001B884ECE|nr:kinase-like domain-containing protein [Suillus clintonianus]KAG2134522.1 kinase-like domain-containing protein [Suillus clintonianus]
MFKFTQLQQFFGLRQDGQIPNDRASLPSVAGIPASQTLISDTPNRPFDEHIPSGRPSTFFTEHSSVLRIKSGDIIKQTNYPTASGGLGDVYRCTWNSGASSDEVAVKSPRFPNMSDPEVGRINKNLDREIHIWATLKHQYVLPLHGTVEEFGPSRALVSPWMPNGTLDSYLKANKTLSMMGRLRLVIHAQNVIHGDLASNNVLVAADGSPRLADFGISNIMVQSSPTFSYHTGAIRWVAPELLEPPENQPIQCATRSTDIYALGGIMLLVLYGKQPYWWLKTVTHLVSARFKHLEPIDSSIKIQPSHLNFMQRCWSTKSEDRPSVEEVISYLQALLNETSL